MGVDALGRLIRINPDIAEEHQLAVIDCLEVILLKRNMLFGVTLQPMVTNHKFDRTHCMLNPHEEFKP